MLPDAALARMLETCPTPVLRIAADGVLTWANEAATPILAAWGCAPGEPVPAPWAARFARVAASREIEEAPAQIGPRRFSLRVCASADRDHVVVYALEGDEEQLGSAILANMSHELRTPLNAIVGYTELLADELCDRGHTELLDDLRKISTSADALRRMIGDLLEIARVEAGRSPLQVDRFELGDLVDDVALTMAPKVEANGNRFAVALDLDPPWIEGDAGKVRRVLTNVVENAAKFTRDGDVAIEAVRAGDRVRLVVRDTGIGMDAEQLTRLFRPFQQGDGSARRRFGGGGLGLALVRVLVEQMQGRVRVDSEVDRGTELTIDLPVRLSP